MNKHHRDEMIDRLGVFGENSIRYIVWFNYHYKVFTRFDAYTFMEVPL